jgi:hypothetical protein
MRASAFGDIDILAIARCSAPYKPDDSTLSRTIIDPRSTCPLNREKASNVEDFDAEILNTLTPQHTDASTH